MFDMRPATMADTDLLFRWANDDQTRAMSKSTATIHYEDHEVWMKYNVAQGYPTHLVMIAESDVGSVGVVRFDTDGDVMAYRVGITIAPQHRGKKFSATVLSHACQLMAEYTLNAEIKPGNVASRHIFERCGFKQTGSDHDLVHYRREPLP